MLIKSFIEKSRGPCPISDHIRKTTFLCIANIMQYPIYSIYIYTYIYTYPRMNITQLSYCTNKSMCVWNCTEKYKTASKYTAVCFVIIYLPSKMLGSSSCDIAQGLKFIISPWNIHHSSWSFVAYIQANVNVTMILNEITVLLTNNITPIYHLT